MNNEWLIFSAFVEAADRGYEAQQDLDFPRKPLRLSTLIDCEKFSFRRTISLHNVGFPSGTLFMMPYFVVGLHLLFRVGSLWQKTDSLFICSPWPFSQRQSTSSLLRSSTEWLYGDFPASQIINRSTSYTRITSLQGLSAAVVVSLQYINK